MKKQLRYLPLLLVGLFIIIVGLQLHFNYTTWKSEKLIFQRKVQVSLHQAREKTFQHHLDSSMQHLAVFLRDSTLITCRWNEDASATSFTVQDLDTSSKGQHRITLSLDQLSARYDSITPQVRDKFIQQFCINIKSDLKDGNIWYYTVNIGKHMENHYLRRAITLEEMSAQFRQALAEQGIPYHFSVNSDEEAGYTTEKVDLAIYKPHGPRYFWAKFDLPFTYFLQQQILSLVGSLLLISLAALTFYRVYKTIFNQEKLSAEKDQFISNVTHELQTPVTAIQLAVDALLQLDCTEEEKHSFINLIGKNSRALSSMTSEILEEARLGFKKETFSVQGAVQHAAILYPHFRVEIISKEEFFLFGEAKLWTNLFKNLLDNAFKYNRAEIPGVKVELSRWQNKLKITVADNGIGIPEQYHARIFERFFRIPTAEIHDVRGYGLGLSLVQHTVERMNGKIEVKNGKEGGSTFTITVPL